ncbi:TPA: hypothetical protein ACTW0G_003654, partial [Raoultella planticola]
KPVIPDYDWSIFGVRVKSRLFLIMTGAYSGSGSMKTYALSEAGRRAGLRTLRCKMISNFQSIRTQSFT